MKRIVSSLFISLGLLSSAAMAQTQPQAVAGEYLIKFKATSGGASLAQSKLFGKASLKASFSSSGIMQIALKPGIDAAATYEALKNDSDVEYIEPNYILSKLELQDSNEIYNYEEVVASGYVQTNSSVYSQANNDSSGVASAWASQTSLQVSEEKIVVAVIDTGLDPAHKVFRAYNGTQTGGTGSLWVNQRELNGRVGVDDDRNGFVDDINGWNFIRNTSNYVDDDGHGTHVAGIVVGAGQNIFAETLQESKLVIMPLKFLGAGGTGSTSDAINAIYYAVNNGARVINNSWGGAGYSRALHDAITHAYNQGVLVISAAANKSSDNDKVPMYPANYNVPSNLAVASSDKWDYLSDFSNYGVNTVHVAAPGEAILSTYLYGGTRTMSGTSMAAPLVAGVAALALREAPTLTGYQVKQLVLDTAVPSNGLYGKVLTGARLGARSLVDNSKNLAGTASSQPVYKPNYSREIAAEDAASGGCGLVSTALMQGGGASGGAGSAGALVFGLLMIPLILWQVLRARDPKNKRRYDRFKMSSEIRVNVGDRELVGAVKTISEGGLSFSVDEALEKGGIVTMRIQSPDGHESIEVQGQVVWSEANQAYGVQFENAKQGALAMIRDWTTSLMKT